MKIEEFTDESIMPIGEHHKKQFRSIPDEWFLRFWYMNQEWYKYANEPKDRYNLIRFRICQYIENNFEPDKL